MEKRLRQKVEEALTGVLGPAEELLVGTNGMHPKLGFNIGTLVTILIGSLAGSAIQAATEWGPDSIGPFAGAMAAMLARWVYIFRSRSELQPAGAIPLIALTNQRLIFVETDLWGRAAGATVELAVAEVSVISLKRSLSGLADATLRTADNRTINYQIRYADRIKTEIEQLQEG